MQGVGSKFCLPNCLLRMLMLFLLTPPAYGQMSFVGIRVVDRGIYRAETIKRTEAPNTTGLINTVQNVRLVENTTTVLGRAGVRFGLRYLAVGSEASLPVPLKLVITFPPTGLRNPETQQVFFSTEQTVSVSIGAAHYWEYHFEFEWEVVPGVWHFQFWQNDRKLAEQPFCVYDLKGRPAPPMMAGGCK